jgi:long-chain acyl-CoA synthetase
MSLNMAMLLTESVRNNATRNAILFDAFKMSYAELHGASNKIANILTDMGLEQGQKIALMLPNIPQFLVCYYGILKAGGVVVPLNVLFKTNEVAYHLEDSESIALFVWESFLGEALPGFRQAETCHKLIVVNAPGSTAKPEGNDIYSFNELMASASPSFDIVQTNSDDTAIILYTSGTTGKPKGAELSHFNIFMNVRSITHELGITWSNEDVGLAALPLFHSFGQTCVMNSIISVGGTLSLMPRFDPVKAFEIIERDRITIFSGVPTMYFYLLNHPDRKKHDLTSLRMCSSGGAAIPVEILSYWKREFDFDILEGYGLSETSPVASFNVTFKEPKAGSVGIPIWGVEMAIMNEKGEKLPPEEIGEIAIRGHNVMKGYYRKPEATAECIRGNGWFYTGDIGKVDKDGYFFIVDRVKDMIIRGGFNVYPREIEELLYSHPAVAECAVVGVPDVVHGEEIKAVVVLKDNASASEDELREYCRERIAAYKYPRYIEVRREQLPKNATGKILKRELRTLD